MDGTGGFSSLSLAALRISAGLVFMQHGLEKMFHFPDAGHNPGAFDLFSLVGVAGVFEVFGGAALVLGLLARPVAFLLSGEMAVAYFFIHVPAGLMMHNGLFPVVNGGDLAVVLCFVFLHICLSGPGPLSVDNLLARRGSDAQPAENVVN